MQYLISVCSFRCTKVNMHPKSSPTKASTAVTGEETSPATKLPVSDFVSQAGGSCRDATAVELVSGSGGGDSQCMRRWLYWPVSASTCTKG